MLQRLLDSLREEELVVEAGAADVKGNGLQLTPILSPRRTNGTGPNEAPLANPDNTSVVSTNNTDLELELQKQLEQASVADIVDSGQYEYRNQPSDLGVTSPCAGISRFRYAPSPLLQDPAFNQHLRATAHTLSL